MRYKKTHWRGVAGNRAVVSLGLAALCGIACWGSGPGSGGAATEEEMPTHSSRSSSTRTAPKGTDTSHSTRTSDTGREARIEAKLDQILANQDQMLAKLDQMMEELKIVKIRATVR